MNIHTVKYMIAKLHDLEKAHFTPCTQTGITHIHCLTYAVSRHNGGQIESPIQTHQYHSAVMYVGYQRDPKLLPMMPRDASLHVCPVLFS